MEEIKKIEVQGTQYGVADMLMRGVMGGNAQVIEWSHTHNMNDYKDAGTYRIKGERTGNPLSDNLPIMNQGSGHTIDGVLYVLDSSLTNGSGKESDCTITQFLMLSNRVGGQEGDMYMRSAYGANKDSLTWKPWEKYQTNMEVGVVSDEYTLNPSNPTQAISYGGMEQLTDNGIYSGIYVPPKAMIGTPSDGTAVIQDATAIETFVMVVINNYAAASNDRCVTQIKFAVTNGGVFSMEKRSTDLGTTYNWSQWESVGGGNGLPEGVSFDTSYSGDKYNFGIDIDNPEDGLLKIGSGIALGKTVKIANNVKIGRDLNIKEEVKIGAYTTIEKNVFISEGVALEYAFGELNITCANNRAAGDIGSRITVSGSDFNFYYGWLEGPAALEGKYYSNTVINAESGYIKFESSEGNKSIGIIDGRLRISKEEQQEEQPSIVIGKNVSIPDNLSFSIADNILTITDGTKTWKLTAEA